MPLRTDWEYGDKAQLARLADISPQYMSDILKGRKKCAPELARIIEKAAERMGLNLNRNDLMYRDDSFNPLLG